MSTATQQLHTATEVVDYMARQHGATMYKQTVWEVCRRHGIQPQPTGNKKRLGITEDELEQLAQSYRPREWNTNSIPQRAPKSVNKTFTLNEDTGRNRERLAPKLERVMVTARRRMLAHRAEVVARMKRMGETAYEASTAIRQGF